MTSICIKVELIAGTNIKVAVHDLIVLAGTLNVMVEAGFNGHTIYALGHSTSDDLLNEYTKFIEREATRKARTKDKT